MTERPYDDAFPSCERADVMLCVYPGDIDPSHVTNLLGIVPTTMNVRGTRIVSALGRARIVRINGWFLSSEREVVSLDLRRHLDWLLSKLVPRSTQLNELHRTHGVRMWLRCAWWSVLGHGGPILSPAQMRTIAELDLDCGFEVMFFGEGD